MISVSLVLQYWRISENFTDFYNLRRNEIHRMEMVWVVVLNSDSSVNI